MKIAYVCADPGIPVFGCKGASIHVQEMIRAFRHQGAMVTLFAARLGGEPPADLADLPVYCLPKVPKGDLAIREQGLFQQNQTLQKLLTQAAPYDLVYERYSLWSQAGMTLAQNWQIPGILEVNAPLIEEQATHRGLINRDLALQVAEKAFGEATALIAVSEGVKSYLQQWVPGDRLFVLPNGVNPTRFSGIPKPSAATPFTVGFVGSLKPWHGLDCLIEAFAQLRQTPILILDEPTSGLDKVNEQLVFAALERLAENRTTFLVTHNLQLAIAADQILYLYQGQIREQGTHAELLARQGVYADLFQRQTLASVTKSLGR